MSEEKSKDVIEAVVVESDKKTASSEKDHLHALGYLIFFLPWCHGSQKSDHELDNWFANQGLLNFIGWSAISVTSGMLAFFNPMVTIIMQIINFLILANAVFGLVSYYQGKRVKMFVYGDIHLIPTKIK